MGVGYLEGKYIFKMVDNIMSWGRGDMLCLMEKDVGMIGLVINVILGKIDLRWV